MLCPVLVGRDEETRHLQAALAAAQAGQGGTVLLTGEAGIGKSRLVRETLRAAGERGVTVLAGRAVAAGVPTPFRPFAEALAPAGRAGRLPGGGGLDEFRPALGRLIPQWRPPQIAGDESLVFLGEAVLQLLRALGPDSGCLLILEDLHWADRETLALLEYLADNISAEPVLCLGTLRAEQGAAARLAAALELRGSAAVVPLSRLDPATTARMALACVGGSGLPEPVQSFVAGRAEGVPFLVEEVLAGLIGDGTLAERDGRWHAADLAVPGLPATFADAVRDRLEGLDADSRQVLGAAAVLDGVPWDPGSAAALDETARQAQARGVLAGRAAWLAHPLFAAARERPEIASQLAAMVAGYPGQHWIGHDPHEQTRRPIDALEQLAMPVLVLAGEQDVPGFRDMSAVLARRIPGARYHIVADAGHMINMEQPAAVNQLLERFLEQLPGAAAAAYTAGPAGRPNGGPDEHDTSDTAKRS